MTLITFVGFSVLLLLDYLKLCLKRFFFVLNSFSKFLLLCYEIINKLFYIIFRIAGSRRTFYAFQLLPSAFSLENQEEFRRDSRTTSESSVRYVALRTFKEWEAALPLKKLKNKSASYKRLNEIQQRRIKLVFSGYLIYPF